MLATGLDEEHKKPKGLADQIVRMLDETDVTSADRLRLLALFLLYHDGLLPTDLERLFAHAQLPATEQVKLRNLEHLGAASTRKLKDSRPRPVPLFPVKPPTTIVQDEYALSRFRPAVHGMLEGYAGGTLDTESFPYTRPPLDASDNPQVAAISLRAAKPTWAKARSNVSRENRQRIIVFMAGGATYSEARSCYDVGRSSGREVVLATTHMLTPNFFLRQVGDLSTHPRSLDIPAERPKPKAPAHLFEPEPQPKPAIPVQAPSSTAPATSRNPGPPTQALRDMNLNRPHATFTGPTDAKSSSSGTTKLTKDPDKKKKHMFFGRKDK